MNIKDNKYNMTMWQGSTFGMGIIVQDTDGNVQNLTGFSARMQIRPSYRSGTIMETLTSANGEITVSASDGRLDLILSAERTAGIDVNLSNGIPPKTVYVYDLEIVHNATNTVSKILWGNLSVYGEVTR